MSVQRDSGFEEAVEATFEAGDETDNGSSNDALSQSAPEHASEDEGFEEGDTLSDEMGDLVEDLPDAEFGSDGDEGTDPSTAAVLDAAAAVRREQPGDFAGRESGRKESTMSDRFESDVMGDLFEEAEGSSHFEEFDEDAYEEDAGEDDEFLSRIVSGVGQAIAGASGGDGFEEMDEWEGDPGEEFESEDSMEDAFADALEAEDADEFFRRLRGIGRRFGRIARQVGRGVGQVARVVAPIASAIPLPQTQAIGRIADIAGQLLADGADEFEAVDELLDLAEEEDSLDAAAPVVAALTLRRTMPGVHRVPKHERRKLVHSVSHATRTLGRQHGAHAARAVPKIVQTAQRAVRQRKIPARALPNVVRQTAARVARNPQVVRRLTGGGAGGAAGGAMGGVARTGTGLARRGLAGGRGQAAGRRYGGTGYGTGVGGHGGCAYCGRRRVFVLNGPVRLTIQGS